MKAKKVLNMLKTKIDSMPEGCNYVIRTSDIEAISKALMRSKQLTCLCCDGTGLCEDIDGAKGSCLTCNGSGTN